MIWWRRREMNRAKERAMATNENIGGMVMRKF